MTDQQSLTRDLWPQPFAWHNLVDVWHTPGFATWWRNTLVYAVAGTALTLLSSLPVAYALAYFRFRGRNVAMMVVIATMMLPPQVSIIPLYLVWAQDFHLTGTLWPLIIPWPSATRSRSSCCGSSCSPSRRPTSRRRRSTAAATSGRCSEW